MKNKNLIISRVAKGLFTLFVGSGAMMYLFSHEMVVGIFEALGFPPYLIYPMAALKISGLITIWLPGFEKLKEWAYAGFTINLSLGILAHVMVGDGEQYGAAMALAILIISYVFSKKAETPDVIPA